MKSFDHLVKGGRFALGVTVGFLVTLFFFIALDFLEFEIFADTAISGAIWGAVIAGLIAGVGQLFVLIENQRSREQEQALAERSQLESTVAQLIRTISTFEQLREHFESMNPFDNMTFSGMAWLSKPMHINDLPDQFSTEQRSLPLSIGNSRLFNILNILDSCISNFVWAHKEYHERMGRFTFEISNSKDVRFKNGRATGVTEINIQDHYEVNDIQKHYIDATYNGLCLSKLALDEFVGLLESRHDRKVELSIRLSEEAWKELFDSVVVPRDLLP